MRTATHLRLLLFALIVWLAFWLAGLPEYYQQYSFTTMAIFSIALVPVIVFAAVKVLGRTRAERRKALGFGLAFYFTVPFALLDYLYCGLYLEHGLEFLRSFWYLTIYYFIPWLIFIPLAQRRG